MATATATRTCSAIVSLAPGEWGFEPVICRQSRYVTTFVTTGDVRVGYCRKPGHELNVRGRFAEQQDPPEPDWDLPESADDITAAKWLDWIRGEGGDVVRWGA